MLVTQKSHHFINHHHFEVKGEVRLNLAQQRHDKFYKSIISPCFQSFYELQAWKAKLPTYLFQRYVPLIHE